MSVNKSNTVKNIKCIFSNICYSIGLLFLFITLSTNNVIADDIIEINLPGIISYDEVPVEFEVSGYLRFETDVIITESNRVYINIKDLFHNLGIYCLLQNEGDQLIGFIENENKKYIIDFTNKQVTIGNKTIISTNGIVKELGAIYLESTILAEAFGISIIFNARSLSIKLEANFELPFVKQMRLEQMRKNIAKLQDSEIITDTIINRDYHLFNFGTMDWSIESYQTLNERTTNRIGFGVGTELLYGQANASVNYDDRYNFTNRNLNYDWRWVDNDKNIIKQAQIGKISYQSISSIYSPVVGATINNSPNTVRKASGFYTINEYTEPNWTVELYINNVLVDYTAADASGLFVFKVPIVYGYTILKLKFYGPLGEERTEERIMNIPFTFTPYKAFDYSVSGGVLEDGKSSRFGRGNFNYGLSRFITIGGGVEYLSSIINTPFIPFANIAFQPFSKLVFNLEYAHDVRMQGLLSYNIGKSAFLQVDYAKYAEGQMAVLFKANEELKVRVSVPFKMNRVSGFTKLNYNQNVYDGFIYNQLEAIFSGYYKNYSTNLATLVNWVSENDPYITSKLSLSYRMLNGFVMRPLVEYNISNSEFLRYKLELEKRISKAYFSISYERNMAYNNNSVYLSFRYDLPYARAGVSISDYNGRLDFSENAQGSLFFGADNGNVKSGNNSALGKGGILFFPFMDLNQNGRKDSGEPMVLLTKVRVTGGKAEISEKDSVVRVSDLNAFINYDIQFSENDLENINWQFTHKTYRVLVDPNQYKRVNVPIIALGEVSGKVYLKSDDKTEGIGRITIQIFDRNGNKVTELLSESDGYFSYLGLKIGKYTIRVDESQMEILGFKCNPCVRDIEIKESIDGDIIEGLDFTLNKINN